MCECVCVCLLVCLSFLRWLERVYLKICLYVCILYLYVPMRSHSLQAHLTVYGCLYSSTVCFLTFCIICFNTGGIVRGLFVIAAVSCGPSLSK